MQSSLAAPGLPGGLGHAEGHRRGRDRGGRGQQGSPGRQLTERDRAGHPADDAQRDPAGNLLKSGAGGGLAAEAVVGAQPLTGPQQVGNQAALSDAEQRSGAGARDPHSEQEGGGGVDRRGPGHDDKTEQRDGQADGVIGRGPPRPGDGEEERAPAVLDDHRAHGQAGDLQRGAGIARHGEREAGQHQRRRPVRPAGTSPEPDGRRRVGYGASGPRSARSTGSATTGARSHRPGSRRCTPG